MKKPNGNMGTTGTAAHKKGRDIGHWSDWSHDHICIDGIHDES